MLLGSSTDQDDDLKTILRQVDAQPRPPIDLVLTNATELLDVGQIAQLHPAHGNPHFGSGHRLQRPEPLGKGAATIVQKQFFYLVTHRRNGNV